MTEDTRLVVEPVRFEMVPHWIMDHPSVTGNAIRLYLLLRRYADRDGVCYPGRRRLAEGLRIAVNTLDAAKDVLVEIGALSVTERDYETNLYTVHWEQPDQKLTPPLPKNCTTPYPKIGYQTNTQRTNTQITTYDRFDDFWSAYPRKAGKQAARKAWATALRTVSADVIIAGAVRYADDPNRVDQYTKHPATWLNAGCWDDEPLPLRVAGKVEQRQQQRTNLLQWAIEQDTRELTGNVLREL